MADPEYVRLHIAPFNPSLLTAILPASILPNARNISYHDVQTFPERAYGFVELPTMDADKVKKKLNGSILKGTKVRIETARPAKEHVIEEPREPSALKAKKEKRTKRKRDEVAGVDIGERQIKRGWTVPATLVGKEKEKKKGGIINKSKYTTEPECLFKTVLPQNVASKASAKDVKPAKGSRKGKEAVVHEFAKATKYATFLRSSAGGTKKKTVSEYVKGKGWVDEDGNVVEAVKSGTLLASKKPGLDAGDSDSESSSEEESTSAGQNAELEKEEQTPVKGIVTPAEVEIPSDNDSSDNSSGEDEPVKIVAKVPEETEAVSEDSSTDSSSENESDVVGRIPASSIKTTALPFQNDGLALEKEEEKENTPTSTSPITQKGKSLSPKAKSESSASDSDSDSESDSSSSEDETTSTPMKATSRPSTSSSAPLNLSITIPPTPPTITTTATTTAVHPLEALYKRPLTTTTSLATPSKPSAPLFSFFDPDSENLDQDTEMEDSQPQVPLTPFTQRDFEWRGMRSAAPTPDTAHANKRFIWPSEQDEDEDEEENGPDAASTPRGKDKGKGVETAAGGDEEGVSAETDFQKWFYEHRGDANRAWKKRRKVVGKEKRQRENRKREERV